MISRASNRIAQQIVDWHIASLRSMTLRGRASWRLSGILWKLASKLNLSVQTEFEGHQLRLPISHPLPVLAEIHPDYGRNIGRVAACIAKKYPGLSMLDIGANVGDTVAAVRRRVPLPVLCIEGSDLFLRYLRTNVASLPGIAVDEAYVSSGSGHSAMTIQMSPGTGRLVEGAPGAAVRTERLSDVLARHPDFRASKLMKIDTDGHDMRIITGAADVLRQSRPVLFFEFDPKYVDPPLAAVEVFKELDHLGYVQVIAYLNTGPYLLSTVVSNTALLEDLTYFISTTKDTYLDCCVFHSEDADLHAQLRDLEIDWSRALTAT